MEFCLLRSDLDDLGDLLGDDRPTANGDLERLDEQLSRKSVHLLGESGREKNDLSIRPNVVDDFHDLGVKIEKRKTKSVKKQRGEGGGGDRKRKRLRDAPEVRSPCRTSGPPRREPCT